eukprot:68970_1
MSDWNKIPHLQECLINGYIRTLESINIPTDINHLCSMYYNNTYINICCRIRPLLPFEIKKQLEPAINLNQDTNTVKIQDHKKSYKFNYDKIYDSNSTQNNIFQDIIPFINNALNGDNISILCYGQTGSGKTFTMQGTNQNKGILFRAMQHILNDNTTKIQFSIIELYNERILDLLHNVVVESESKYKILKKTKKRAVIKIKHLENRNILIEGLKQVEIRHMEDFIFLNDTAKRNRSMAVTSMGACSTRSHLLWICDIKQYGQIYFVELAGSERVKKSGAIGQALKEAQNINKSLSALGDVLSSIQNNYKFIPYRNSILTNILMNHFGETKNSQMVMCLNVCPTQYHEFETISTLKFGERISSKMIRARIPFKKKKKKK